MYAVATGKFGMATVLVSVTDLTLRDAAGWNVLHHLCSFEIDGSGGVGSESGEGGDSGVGGGGDGGEKKGSTLEAEAVRVMQIIVAAGGKVHERDQQGSYPAHIAARSNQVEIVRYLIELYYFPLNLRNHAGLGMLHLAASRNHVEMCSFLLGAGSDPLLISYDGMFPVDLVPDFDVRGESNVRKKIFFFYFLYPLSRRNTLLV